jgi:rfaE bifunctional protein nucleotidyltransferase chain/domain
LGEIISRTEIQNNVAKWRQSGKKIVFTNGCFDILHRGHVEYLIAARQQGDLLIIGVNTDASVKMLKGNDRPLVGEQDRAFLLSQLLSVDVVVLFSEETPYNLICDIKPDVLVKGGDYSVSEVVGRDVVEASGGKVVIIPLVPGKSTSSIIKKIQLTQ